jgi:hypothetical protein
VRSAPTSRSRSCACGSPRRGDGRSYESFEGASEAACE